MKPNAKENIVAWVKNTTRILVVILLSAHPIFAGSDSGADFLKIPIGAEPAGLGQAYTALAHGINALNWNPAGILQTPSYLDRPTLGLSLSHQDQFANDNLDHLGLIVPNRTGGNAWGIDLIRLSYADQQGRDEQRRLTGSVKASDLAFGAAFAHNFGPAQVGTQLKIIRQELAGKQANGFAIDLGILSATPFRRLSMGASVKNLGPQMKFLKESYDLPLTLSVGSAYHITGPLTLALDIHYKPHQRQTVMAIGTQLFASNFVTLRAGYLSKLAEAVTNNQRSETNRGNFGSVSGITGGMGLHFKQFNLDYALTPFGELGNTQMLTLSTWFGDRSTEKNSFDSPDQNISIQPVPSNRIILILPISNESWWNSLHP